MQDVEVSDGYLIALTLFLVGNVALVGTGQRAHWLPIIVPPLMPNISSELEFKLELSATRQAPTPKFTNVLMGEEKLPVQSKPRGNSRQSEGLFSNLI